MIDAFTLWNGWDRRHKKLISSAQFAHWYEWERTFLFIPKSDINGKLILGRAWKRERHGSVTGEYDPTTHTTTIYQCTEIAYATKKGVFMEKLKDKLNDT